MRKEREILARNAPNPFPRFCWTTFQALVFPPCPSSQRIIKLAQNRREHRSIITAVVVDPTAKNGVETSGNVLNRQLLSDAELFANMSETTKNRGVRRLP